MRPMKFAGFFLFSLCFILKGDAQSRDVADKPVWTLEFVKVHPTRMGQTLGYLDQNWMRVRLEAKRRGSVLGYHRVSEVSIESITSETEEPTSIVLLTEYKNLAAFATREALFTSIREHLPKDPGIVTVKQQDLYEVVETRVFMEQPAAPEGAQFKLLAKQ